MVVKTYRGVLATDGQEKIPLTTKDGSIGYRMVKFEIISATPGLDNEEAIVKIYKTFQATIDAVVDFSDNDLLGVGFSAASSNTYYAYGTPLVIFDTEIFNQDIFVTYKSILGSAKMNYYIELEQMKLDHTQNMSATLKAIRGSAVD